MSTNAGIFNIGPWGSPGAGPQSAVVASMMPGVPAPKIPILRKIGLRPRGIPTSKPGWIPPLKQKKDEKKKERPKFKEMFRRRDRSLRDLRGFFRHEVGRFRDVFPKDKEFYAYPWFMMVGEKGSGKTTLLGASGLQHWSAEHAAGYPGSAYCGWWCSGSGAVLDTDGAFMLAPPTDEPPSPIEKDGWRTLMNLLRRHRQRRPLDGVLLTIPASDLVGPNRLDDASAHAKGDALARKLRMIGSRLGMSVPVYLMITKCDQITGFTDFCTMLPPERQGEIFGWSNPNPADSPYEENWIDDAFNSMGGALSPVRLEMFAELPDESNGDGLFLFPSELRSIAPALRAYLEPIFVPGGTHARLMMRGLYLTGDATALPPAPITGNELSPSILPLLPLAPDGAPHAVNGNGNGYGNGNGHAAPQFPGTPAAQQYPPPTPGGAEGGGAEGGAAVAAPEPPVQRTIFFAERIFYKKIFPEFTVAHPLSRIGFAKNRMVLALQIASLLVILLGLVAAYVEYPVLRSSVDTFYVTLDTIRHDLHASRLGSVHPTDEDVLHAQHLLDGIIRTEQCRIISPLFPSSWFSPLHDSVDMALAHAFDQIIMRAMYQQLVNKVGGLREYAARRELYQHGNPAFAIEDSYEFRTLREFADELIRLQTHADLYNGLKTTRRMDDVGALIEYLFERELPEGFVTKAKHFAGSIENLNPRPFVYTEHRDTLMPVVDDILGRLLGRLFNGNVILTSARTVRDSLQELSRGGVNGFAATSRFAVLAKNIGTLNAALMDSSFAWLSRPDFEAGEELKGVLHDLDLSPFLNTARVDSQITTRFIDSCRVRFVTVKQEIRGLTSDVIGGPIVPVELATDAFIPSATLDSLKVSIDMMLAKSFMRARSRGGLGYRPGYSRQLIWNADELGKAVKLFDEFNVFTDETLPSFPDGLEPVAMLAARTCFEATAVDVINGSHRTETNAPSPESVRREVQSLQKASPNLSRLLDLFDRQYFTVRGDLLGMLWSQSEGIFGALTDARESNRDLYAINNHGVQRWMDLTQPIDRPLSALLLDIEEEPAIAEKMAADRAYVEELAQQGAQPALEFLGSIGMSSRGGEVEEWRKILAELQKYARGVPGNSVASLEALFMDLNNITEANFREKLIKKGTTNYFLRRREYLRSTLDTMFSSRSMSGAVAAYNELRSTFNTMLLGRYPFIDFTAHESKRINSVMLDEIDEYMGRLDAFIVRYDQIRKGWGRADATLEEKGAHAFIDSMLRVRYFLSPIIDADSEQQAYLMLDVEFRANQTKEIGGRDIIGWTLDVGDRRFTIQEYVRDGSHPLRTTWRIGDKINLQLRWAENSPVMPHDVFLGRARVDGELVDYSFNSSTWSLVHLLSAHRAPLQHLERNSPPHVLEFAINTIGRVNTADAVTTYATPPPIEARVFMRISVVGRSRKDHVMMPVFPTVPAPELGKWNR